MLLERSSRRCNKEINKFGFYGGYVFDKETINRADPNDKTSTRKTSKLGK